MFWRVSSGKFSTGSTSSLLKSIVFVMALEFNTHKNFTFIINCDSV